MCVHFFKRYLHQTWNYILRSIILLTLGGSDVLLSGQDACC